MSTRRFFLIAFIGAFLAVGLHVGALSQFGRSATTRARLLTVAEPERAAILAGEHWHSSVGHIVMYSGAALAVASIVCVIISARRREPARRSLVFGLLLCYLLLQFIMV